MRAEAGGEAVWGVTGPLRGGSLSGLLGRVRQQPHPPIPRLQPPPLCFPREKTPTNHPGKVSLKGRSVREIAYLSAGDDLRQTTVTAFVVFFPRLLLFFSVVAQTGPFHTEVAAKTLEQIPRLGMSAVSSSQIGLSDYQTLL